MNKTKSETRLAAIAGLHQGWIPVDKALPETGIQVAVTTMTKKGLRGWNKAWIDEQGFWHGSGTFAEVTAWRPIKPWKG